MIQVIIADDHPIVRAGLKQIIMEDAGITVAGEAENGNDLLAQVRRQDYDVILLDLTMPGMDGLDVLKQLKIEKPHIPVVILTIHTGIPVRPENIESRCVRLSDQGECQR